MGNAQVHERTCGKFPSPSIARSHMISNNNNNNTNAEEKTTTSTTIKNKEDGSDTSASTAATTSTTTDTATTTTATTSVFKTIKNTLRDLWDPPEPERLPPRRLVPKHLLYGCSTVEEHYECMDQLCEQVASLKGLEGLQALGLEYRLVHHAKNCNCPGQAVSRHHNNGNTEDDLTNSEVDPEDLLDGYMEESDDNNEDGDTNNEYGQFDDNDDNEASSNNDNDELPQESFLVPIKSSSGAEDSCSDARGGASSFFAAAAHDSMTAPSANVMHRNTSTVSLFSLATHTTDTDWSNPTTGTGTGTGTRRYSRPLAHNTNNHNSNKTRFPLATISSQPALAVMEQDSCALRLHHVPSGGTLITLENHLKFIPDGKLYDEVARLCMEYSQQVMMQEGNLEWIHIRGGSNTNGSNGTSTPSHRQPQDTQFGALVTKSYLDRQRQRQRQQAPSTNDTDNGRESPTPNKTLVIVTGKGQVQAGIFSRRHLLVTSMEAATALPFVRGAKERGMDVVILDPNALGYRNAMDVVETSLHYLFLQQQPQQQDNGNSDNINDTTTTKDEIYILAHSMAGAQIVRFFTSNSSSFNKSSNGGGSGSGSGGDTTTSSNTTTTTATMTNSQQEQRDALLKRIRAVAFTDSNHNINWTKHHAYLTQLLTGPPSLYIKSHKVHEKAKSLGELHHDCQFWKHRFGTIKTLWAGTHEHAMTNYTARDHIWDHFDTFLNAKQPQQEQEQQEPQQEQQAQY